MLIAPPAALSQYVAFTTPILIKTFFVGDNFRRGPWHLGVFSRPIGCMSCSFVVLMIPILCFPRFVIPIPRLRFQN